MDRPVLARKATSRSTDKNGRSRLTPISALELCGALSVFTTEGMDLLTRGETETPRIDHQAPDAVVWRVWRTLFVSLKYRDAVLLLLTAIPGAKRSRDKTMESYTASVLHLAAIVKLFPDALLVGDLAADYAADKVFEPVPPRLPTLARIGGPIEARMAAIEAQEMAIARGQARRAERMAIAPIFETPEEQSFYEKYMHSGAWLVKREQAFAKYGRSCNRCGTASRLCLHHKTYERLGAEWLDDLEVLCSSCHYAHHKGTSVMVQSTKHQWGYRAGEALALRTG